MIKSQTREGAEPGTEGLNMGSFLPYLLAHASLLVSRHVDSMAAAENIGRNECKVLLTLIHREGMSLTQMADIMLVKQPTLSRIVDGMVEGGLIERRIVAEDRRAIDIRLTAAGRTKAAPLLEHANKLDRDIFDRLGQEEAGSLKQLLNRLIALEAG